jgi:hypothetical protein
MKIFKYKMKLNFKERRSLHLLFAGVAGDNETISSVEFFRICKLLKVYPNLVPFDQIKKIILKDPVYWKSKRPQVIAGTVNDSQVSNNPYYDNTNQILSKIN